MKTYKVELGTLISSENGRCGGPQYGEVYTAPKGQKGYIAGYRRHDCVGAGLMGIERFETLQAAQSYSISVTMS